MTNWKKLIERIDGLTTEIVLADISPDDNSGKALIDILSSFCVFSKAALNSLDRGEDSSEHIKSFEELIKAKSIKSAITGPKTYFDSHTGEIHGFVSSTKGLLEDAEHCLLALERSPEDKKKIDEGFRIFHTLKGEANLTGLTSIGILAHEAEDLLGALRAGTIKADGQVITTLLKAVDQLRKLIDFVSVDPQKAALEDVGILVNQLQAEKTRKRSNPPLLELSNGGDLYMDFASEAFDHLANSEKSVFALESAPGDAEAINNIFRAFHTIKGAARFLDLKDIQALAHESETMLDMVRKGTLRFEGRIVELSLLSIDGIRKLLLILQEQVANNGQIKGEYPDIGLQVAALKEVLENKKNQPIGQILIKQGVITDLELSQALKIQKGGSLDNQKSGNVVGASIRIQLEKLDALMDMVGELVITESQVSQSPEMLAIKKEHFQRNFVEFDRITRNLQQLVMGLRLVTIGPVFQKMERLLRDLSKAIGKDVLVVLNGEETEIDKNMAELISDPLMHMVRNSLDHGIEFKEERLALAKPEIGKVELSAYHKGGFVVIEVKDDGAGLKRDKILKKAIEQRLIKEGTILSDNQIFNLIFEPGFSTANIVTDVSGRGVGMDVVRKNVDKLQGKIYISSEEGKGAVFSIYFPITLAIVDGIVIKVAQERYILPINSVIEFVRPKEIDRVQVYDKQAMYKVYEKIYPLIYLNDVFGIENTGKRFEEQTICIIESDFGRACMVVDELLGQQQVVIKSLGKNLTNIPGVSGAAILGDGCVGLILDAGSLIESVFARSEATKQSL